MAYFSDGKIAKIHEVNISIHTQYLEFKLENKWIRWDFKDIILIDREFYKISIKNDDDARLTLSQQDFEALSSHVKSLNQGFHHKKELKLIGVLVAASVSFAAIIFYGIPILAVPLAKMTSKSFEEKIGQSVESQLELGFDFCVPEDKNKQIILENLVNKIAKNADLDTKIKVGVIDMPITNAFAMPAGRLYLTQGLLNDAKNSEEIAAVIGHEISHIESKDVLVGLYRSMGYAIILDAIIGGGSGVGQQAIVYGANLTDLKHSRDVESRSDLRGLELLHKAGIDGSGMESFFKTLGEKELIKNDKLNEILEYSSSHPNSDKRSETAKKHAKKGQKALTDEEFKQLKSYCN